MLITQGGRFAGSGFYQLKGNPLFSSTRTLMSVPTR